MLDEFLIQIHPIGQEHIGKGAPVLVVAVSLERDFLAKDHGRGRVLRLLPVGLALLRAINPAEADTFGMMAVQDFDGVTVEDGDDLAGELARKGRTGEQ